MLLEVPRAGARSILCASKPLVRQHIVPQPTSIVLAPSEVQAAQATTLASRPAFLASHEWLAETVYEGVEFNRRLIQALAGAPWSHAPAGHEQGVSPA
jgi:hypothetical protein